MKRAVFLLFLLSAEIAQVAGQRLISNVPREMSPRTPYVREINYVVETLTESDEIRQAETMYCLYVGSRETELIDHQAEDARIVLNVSLVHPVPAVVAGLNVPAFKRWYAVFTDSDRHFTKTCPLLEKSAWSMVPDPAKHVLKALGTDDDDLILISWNGLSGSMSIFYQPMFNNDRDFYEGKRELLVRYMKTHDFGEPFELTAE